MTAHQLDQIHTEKEHSDEGNIHTLIGYPPTRSVIGVFKPLNGMEKWKGLPIKSTHMRWSIANGTSAKCQGHWQGSTLQSEHSCHGTAADPSPSPLWSPNSLITATRTMRPARVRGTLQSRFNMCKKTPLDT